MNPNADEPVLPDDHSDVSDDELFSSAMEDVAPIAKGRQQNLDVPRKSTGTYQHRRDAALGLENDKAEENFLTLAEVPMVQPLEYLEWKKDGVQRAVFDKLRRGGYAIEDRLDLHRKTVKQARDLVYLFVKRALARGQRCLLLSPGKGAFSDTPARLKSYVAAWLRAHPEIIAYCSAQRQHGGVGAVYVLVRKSDSSRELNREQHGGKSDWTGV